MIVGSTAADVTTDFNWVASNWSLVKPGDPSPYTGGDNPPCAFACHDIGEPTQPSGHRARPDPRPQPAAYDALRRDGFRRRTS